jgi:hypothetical protein
MATAVVTRIGDQFQVEITPEAKSNLEPLPELLTVVGSTAFCCALTDSVGLGEITSDEADILVSKFNTGGIEPAMTYLKEIHPELIEDAPF